MITTVAYTTPKKFRYIKKTADTIKFRMFEKKMPDCMVEQFWSQDILKKRGNPKEKGLVLQPCLRSTGGAAA